MGILGLWLMGCPHPLAEPQNDDKPPNATPSSAVDAGTTQGPVNIADAGFNAPIFDAGSTQPTSQGTDAGGMGPADVIDAGMPMDHTDAGPAGLVHVRDAGPAPGEDAGLPKSFNWGDYDQSVQASWLENPPACTDEDWLAKYLKYRQRLRGSDDPLEPGFVSVGPDQGQSLPASRRDPDMSCVTGYYIEIAGSCVPNALPSVQGGYFWGDTTVHLGYYLATLATEYAAFDVLGLDTSQTVSDLYFALMAFNRLDEHAEETYGMAPERNGFFLRDDVPGGFWQASDGRHRFPRDDDFSGFGCMFADYNCGDVVIDGGDYISQDQAVGMAFGLAFVHHLIPESVSYGGEGLRDMAIEMVHRIVINLRDNDWKIIDPNGETPPAAWGGNVQGFSNQLAKVANRVVGDAHGIDDYRDTISLTVGTAALAGLDASWQVQLFYNKGMALEMVAVTDSWTANHLAKRARDINSPLYAYAHAVLNGNSVSEHISDWQVSSALTEAPCGGPCNNVSGCEQRPGWRGSDRWRSSGGANSDVHGRDGEYNGMDYMLMHNLLVLYHDGKHTKQIPNTVPTTCGSFQGLDTFITDGPSPGQTYDGYDECSVVDQWRHFCGRPWAQWLEDAYEGRATIFTGTGKWTCSPGHACTIDVGDEEGTAGVDLFIGTGGADTFDGHGGNDCIYGFGEADHLEGNQGADEIHGGYGNDEIYGESDTLNIDGEPDTLFGEEGNDFLHGGPSTDVMYGGPGRDDLEGGPDNDYLSGGPDNDVLVGEAGHDIMEGDDGNDTLRGSEGDDFLMGGDGDDKLNGDSGDDNLRGGAGNDFLRGGLGNDALWASHGDDRLCGNGGDDMLDGYGGDDTCRGGSAIGGGTDDLRSCEHEGTYSECTESAFNDWAP